MEFLQTVLVSIKNFIMAITAGLSQGFSSLKEIGVGQAYTTVARWIFIILALIILIRAIISLLKSKNPGEVWGYFNVDGIGSQPITHWENAVGRSKSSDLIVDDKTASRNQGILTMVKEGLWKFTEVGSTNGTFFKGKKLSQGESVLVCLGDTFTIGQSNCTLFPISLEEKRNNMLMRMSDTMVTSPWKLLIPLTIFQFLTIIQLKISLGEEYTWQITASFLIITAMQWIYVAVLKSKGWKAFEIEVIALFLATLSLAVTASKFQGGALKQAVAIILGMLLFVAMCWVLRDIERAIKLKKYLYAFAAVLLVFNLVFARARFGANNWVVIGGVSFQPSEIVKLAYIWVGAATLDELMEKKNSLVFTIFSGFCFVCLALMGDFGTALIFFVTFLVISFLRSGDFTKLILVVGLAFIGGLLVLRFKSYVAARFSTWGHVWEYPDAAGFQQTRTLSAAASGGLVGVGAGDGWLKNIPASETDLVFGFLTEEWGLIIAIMAVLAIVTLTLFAVRSIWAGRTAFYTIAACSSMALFIFQTMLNVFGSVDLFPLTGVTFPFVSNGGSSMISSWGMLAFLKAADTRLSASMAVTDDNVGEEDVA